MKGLLLGGVATLAMGGIPFLAPAQAEQAAAGTQAPASSSTTDYSDVNDIIVTAQRREERLQDVPVSVAAFSGDQLAARGATRNSDIGQLTTGVIVAEQDSAVVPYIRGIGSDTILLGEVGSVATYVDGVYLPDATGGIYELANVESIEVLKGPQGTLFGRNTAGGAINIRTKTPKFTPEGSIEASYGNFDAVSARGYISGPVNDMVAVSLAGNYSRQDSYINDLVRGGKIDNAERYTIRAAVLFKPTDRLDITLTGDYLHNSDPTGAAISAAGGYLGATPTTVISNRPFQYVGNEKPEQRLTQKGVSLRSIYDFGGASLMSLTAYRTNRVYTQIEVDRTPFNFIDLYSTSPAKVFSQEFQLSSSGDGPLTWMIGGYYAHQNSKYNPIDLVGTLAGGLTRLNISSFTDIYALFANATYKLGAFEVTGGLRYNKDKKSYNGKLNGTTLITRDIANKTWNSVTPRLVLAYHPGRDMLLYASYTGGFKSGAYNVAGFETVPVNPEKVDAFELGLKLTPTPRVTINSALFWYDRKNVQVQAQNPVTSLVALQNAAKSRTKGAEIELSARPVPGLSLNAGISYLNANYNDFPDAIVYIPNPVPAGAIPGSLGNAAVRQNVTGQRVERSPKWTYNLGVSYKADLGDGRSLVPSANLFRTTSYYFNRGSRLRQPGYTLINADLAFNLSNGVTFSVWGKNLNNKTFIRSYVTNAFADSISWSEPRTYGVRASYRF